MSGTIPHFGSERDFVSAGEQQYAILPQPLWFRATITPTLAAYRVFYGQLMEGRSPVAANPIEFPSALQLRTTTTNGSTVVHCTGKLTSDTAEQLKNEVKRLLLESQVITLDLSDLAHLDSSGLGALVGLYVSARVARRQLRLINLNQKIKDLLGMTRLASVFEGYGEHL